MADWTLIGSGRNGADALRLNDWIERAEAAVAACKARGGSGDPVEVQPPASATDVERIEASIGQRLPDSFRRVVLEHAAAFRVFWHLEGVEPPGELGEIFCGDVSWNLWKLPDLEAERRRWVKDVFPDPQDDYDRVWHGKLAIHQVRNGDLVALDLATQSPAALVYLSHDDGEGHGHVLGEDFASAFERWSRIGFPGAEDWQWLPFTASRTGGIDPDCATGRQWRNWLGLDDR